MKPVYEQTVNAIKEKKSKAKDQEDEALDVQLNDICGRWEAIEEAVNKQESFIEELAPIFVEYHEKKDRLAHWLKDSEDKLEDLAQVDDITSKELNSEIKVWPKFCKVMLKMRF